MRSVRARGAGRTAGAAPGRRLIPTRDDASQRDATDPLSEFVDAFVRPDPDLVYFDGHSLGRPPHAAIAAVRAALDAWSADLVRGWDRWLDLPREAGDRLAAAALGAAPGQVVVCDSTTVNLHKLIGGALDATARRVVVTDLGNFPTDRDVAQWAVRQRGGEMRWLSAGQPLTEKTVSQLLDDDVAIATFSAVDYRSAAIADVAAITAAVHASGALALWDLSHMAGVVPADLDAWGVDLAVGCTYKYLNAGPGSPAWLYVRRGLQDGLRSAVPGWFGRADPFDMDAPFTPAPGITRWLAGTPPVVGLAAVDAAVGVLAEAGITAVRHKAMALSEFARSLVPDAVAPAGPADPATRGGHLALRHPEAYRLSVALREGGVVADVRPPDLLRIGLSPLTTRFTEVWDGMARLRALVDARAWERIAPRRSRVT